MDYQKQSKNAQSGAADQEMFIKEFEDIPKRHTYNNYSLEDNIETVKSTLENSNTEWDKRIEAMQVFRCILIDLIDTNFIVNSLKDLELSFQLSLKDLRSKVVREACVTIAYTSVKLQNKCEKFIENLLPLLFNLTQNSTKIMSTSAGVAIRFIIQNTHSGKFISIITQNLGSKSKEIRRYCCDFLNQLLRTWSKSILEKFIPLLSSAILKGLNDADPEARCFSRKAFCMFDYHFKEKANQLFSTLDFTKRKMIEKEKMADLNDNSIQCIENTKPTKLKTHKKFIKPTIKIDTSNMILLSPVRAASSIDIGAARSATLRAKLKFEEKSPLPNPLELSSHKNSQNNSFKSSTNKKIIDSPSKTQSVIDKQLDKNSISRLSSKKISPLNRICRSQPTSRSTSPNPRYITNLIDLSSPYSDLLNGTLKSRKSLIPISSKSSTCDELSPRININKSLTPKNTLLDSRLRIDSYINNFSDQSEVSSLCSDKSFSDQKIDDIDEIIKNLNSIHWINKKEGLISLEHFIFNSSTALNQDHYKQLTEIFTKMLLDPNTKALSLVLSVLNIFIINNHGEIHFWLYVLLSRLFLKTGSDLLSSIQKRIIKTFDVIADSFPKNLQFNTLVQFISDNKLTPVLKVKITSLQYLLKLILQMDPSDLKCTKENQENFQNFLMKIICWTEDKKSPQLRSLAQDIILELFNLNTPEFCNLASYLSRDYWDTAYKFMKDKNINRKPSVDESLVFSQSFYDQILKSSFIQNEEELNHTDVFDSLMKTTEEINKFTSDLNNESFSNLKENFMTLNKNDSLSPQSLLLKDKYKVSYTKDDSNSSELKKVVVNEKKTCSLDSGISQLDEAASNNKTNSSAVLSDSTTYLSPEKQDNINISSGSDLTTYNSFKSVNSFYVSSSSQKNESDVISEENFLTKHLDYDENEDTNEINNNSQNFNNYSNSLEDLSLNDTKEVSKSEVQKLELLINNIQNFESSKDDRKKNLEELNEFLLNKENQINKTPTVLIDKLIICILDTFDDKDLVLRQLAIKTLSDLINVNQESFYLKYELVLSKIVFMNEQDYKELSSNLQTCTESISKFFCFKKCVGFLVKTINNNQYPSNEACIKILTKFIKNSDEETVNFLVPKIMPSIVRSYDNSLSSVRKFSVFCLVQLFNRVGMVIKPHLSSLDLSKIKLLKIYIDNSKPSRSSSPLLER